MSLRGITLTHTVILFIWQFFSQAKLAGQGGMSIILVLERLRLELSWLKTPDWVTEWIQGKPGLYSNTVLHKIKTEWNKAKKKKKNNIYIYVLLKKNLGLYFVYVCFWRGLFWDRVFLELQLAWNSLLQTRLASVLQRSICLCLLSVFCFVCDVSC